jgi:hypothetical protein
MDLREVGCADRRRWDFLTVFPLPNFGISDNKPFLSFTSDNSSGDDDDTSGHPSTMNWYRKVSLGAQRSSPVSSYPRY